MRTKPGLRLVKISPTSSRNQAMCPCRHQRTRNRGQAEIQPILLIETQLMLMSTKFGMFVCVCVCVWLTICYLELLCSAMQAKSRSSNRGFVPPRRIQKDTAVSSTKYSSVFKQRPSVFKKVPGA